MKGAIIAGDMIHYPGASMGIKRKSFDVLPGSEEAGSRCLHEKILIQYRKICEETVGLFPNRIFPTHVEERSTV
jgi:hypothetical protein